MQQKLFAGSRQQFFHPPPIFLAGSGRPTRTACKSCLETDSDIEKIAETDVCAKDTHPSGMPVHRN
jgi:hypothetical protein